MRTRLLAIALLLLTPTLYAQTQTYATITASGIKDEGGNLLSSGELCFLPVSQTTGLPMNYTVVGDGQRSRAAVCGAVSNGAVTPFQLTNSQITFPANACYRATVTDITGAAIIGSASATAKSGYQCVQMNSTWCSMVGSTYTCNWDDYLPDMSPQLTVQTGPPGPAGPASLPTVSIIAPTGLCPTLGQGYLQLTMTGTINWACTDLGLPWAIVSTVMNGYGYALPAYGSGGTQQVAPSNITTDSTGNNMNVPGVINVGGAPPSMGPAESVANFLGSATAYGNLNAWQPVAATSSANQNSPFIALSANYWNGLGSLSDQWGVANVLGTGTTPTSTLFFTHSGPGVASISFPVPVSVAANPTSPLQVATKQYVDAAAAAGLPPGVTSNGSNGINVAGTVAAGTIGPTVIIDQAGNATTALNALTSSQQAQLGVSRSLTANTTVAGGLTVLQGGMISCQGYSLSVNGQFTAPPSQLVFDSTCTDGLVKINQAEAIYPNWWGFVNDNATDGASALQSALDAAYGSGANYGTHYQGNNIPVRILPGIYVVKTGILAPNGSKLIGPSSAYGGVAGGQTAHGMWVNDGGAVINFQPATQQSFFTLTGSTGGSSAYSGVEIANLHIWGNSSADTYHCALFGWTCGVTTSLDAINFAGVQQSQVHDVAISGFVHGIEEGSRSQKNTFDHVDLEQNVYDYYIGPNTLNIEVTSTVFSDCILRTAAVAAYQYDDGSASYSGDSLQVRFHHCYIEDISDYGFSLPKGAVDWSVDDTYGEQIGEDSSVSDRSVFYIGHQANTYLPNGYYLPSITVRGGQFAGDNAPTQSAFLNVNASNGVNLFGPSVKRFAYGILATSNTQNNSIELSYPVFNTISAALFSGTTNKINGCYRVLDTVTSSTLVQCTSSYYQSDSQMQIVAPSLQLGSSTTMTSVAPGNATETLGTSSAPWGSIYTAQLQPPPSSALTIGGTGTTAVIPGNSATTAFGTNANPWYSITTVVVLSPSGTPLQLAGEGAAVVLGDANTTDVHTQNNAVTLGNNTYPWSMFYTLGITAKNSAVVEPLPITATDLHPTDASYTLGTLAIPWATAYFGTSYAATAVITPSVQTSAVQFPSTTTSSPTPHTQSNYYEYTAASAACTGALTVSVVWKVTRVGNVVTLTLPPTSGTATASAYFQFGVLLPTDFRPSTTMVWPLSIKNASANLSAPGMLLIGTDGSIKVYEDMVGSGTFSTSGTSGLGQSAGVSVSWTI